MSVSKLQRLVWVVLLNCLVVKALAIPTSFTDGEAESIDRFLQQHFDDSNFGVVIGLIDQSGSRVFAAGKLDNGTDQRVDGDTLFEIGSITKTFTSLLLLEMAERGEVQLDDPVTKFLPPAVSVPKYGENDITLHHLACQDSGLPFDADNLGEGYWLTSFNAYTAADMYEFLGGYQLPFEPGERFRYSNLGMSLLGHALERRTGQDYESLVVQRICEPLKLEDTRITLSDEQKQRLARGHNANGHADYYQLQVMQPAGSLCSTANDMLKYLSAQLGLTESALTPLLVQSQKVQHPRAPGNVGNTAMPWLDSNVYLPAGSQFLGHGGGTAGFATFIGFDLQRRRGVAVLSSQRGLGDDQSPWAPQAMGWSILQGLPLTLETATRMVYEVVGIGAALEKNDNRDSLKITKVFAQSPAGKAGLSAGTVIRKINGVSVEDKSMAECLQLLGGPLGTSVLLECSAPDQNETKDVRLTREKFLTIG